MYLARRGALLTEEIPLSESGSSVARWRHLIVDPNVAWLGMTSLVTDISSEMVAAVLPLYLTVRLGFTALQFGATDGLLQLATAVTALAGALLADRRRRYREVAGAGYSLSAASRLGLMSATGWLPTLGWLSVDRLGKGIRTGPRDALISLSAPRGRMAEAFGLHRMLDTGGALLGPLAAIVMLSVAPGSYQTVFVASFLIAVIGLAILWLFVQNRGPHRLHARARLWSPVAALWPQRGFRRLLLATVLLSLPAVSDSFLFLTARHQVGIDQRWFPVLFVSESVIFLFFAVPLGRIADRIGAGRVLLGGQVALAASYALLLATPSRTVVLALVPVCLGVFFAATDGVLAALASHIIPTRARTTGLAVLGVALAGGRAAAAAGFGLVWMRSGPDRALGVALVALLVAALAATVAVRPLMSAGTDRHKADPGGGPPPRSTASADVNPPLPAPSGTPEHRPLGRRIGALAMITVVSAAGVVAVTARNARRLEVAARSSSAHLAATQRLAHPGQAQQQPSLLSASLAGLLARPHLLVLDTTEGNSFERLEVADANNPTGPRALTPLECWRVDERAGRGICLTGDRVQATQAVTVFDNTFKVLFTIPVEGTPSRTRVAPNGQIGAATTFVAGDAYNVDNFSTHTVLVDLISGRIIADLEHFTITKGGHAFHPIDENFWGVTFAADSDTFYATMRTGSHYYLIRGHARTRRGEILRDGVECPSISPDGTLLVYKSRIDHGFDPATWELHVLVLANLADHPLAETRNVDDQAAWADNTHVVYGIASTLPGNGTTDTWTVPADGTGTPTLLVPAGESPVPAPAEGP